MSGNFFVLMSVSDVIRLHDMVIDRFGGKEGIHSAGLLESAINHPWMILEFGEESERQISFLAATYFFHIIKNHPFVDGNKRTGLLTTLEFVYRNGFHLEADFDILYDLSLKTASSNINKEEVSVFFKKTIISK